MGIVNLNKPTMKIKNEEQYNEALVFLDSFFEEPEMYSKEDAEKVKKLL
jgi:antitoxin component HigA of HigAB toxin-antitoxin module